MAVSKWSPSWPLNDDTKVQCNPGDFWKNGETWAKYEVYKEASTAGSARSKAATDHNLKTFFRMGAIGVMDPDGNWVFNTEREMKGDMKGHGTGNEGGHEGN